MKIESKGQCCLSHWLDVVLLMQQSRDLTSFQVEWITLCISTRQTVQDKSHKRNLTPFIKPSHLFKIDWIPIHLNLRYLPIKKLPNLHVLWQLTQNRLFFANRSKNYNKVYTFKIWPQFFDFYRKIVKKRASTKPENDQQGVHEVILFSNDHETTF